MTELHLASIWEAISDEIADAAALVHDDRRITWRELDDRAARLSSAFSAAGLVPGSVVAIDLYNCPELVEVFVAAIKGGFVPTLVNYRYRAAELTHLLADARAELVVAHPDLVGAVRDVAPDLPVLRRVVVLGDEYENTIASNGPAARRRREGEGCMLSYTGGTTGSPKGVVYPMPGLARQALGTRSLVGVVTDPSDDPAGEAASVARSLHAEARSPVCCPASPLMHSTAFTFVSLPTLAAGGTLATFDNRRFDPDVLLDVFQRHTVTATAVVGDAFARPLVEALDRRAAEGRPFDASTLRIMCSAGVAFSADSKRRLLDHLPELTIIDACGASEGAAYGHAIARRGDDLTTSTFVSAPGTIVVDEQRRRVPDGEVGLISATVVTSGYHADIARTATTFYDDGEVRRAIPGDFGRIEPDGRLTLLGRGSTVINTGGEKVHPEEVEDVIKTMPGVVDAVVWRVPDERLGSVVGAVVQGDGLDAAAVTGHVRDRLAGYKAPRRVVFVDTVPRHANGKLDADTVTALLRDGV